MGAVIGGLVGNVAGGKTIEAIDSAMAKEGEQEISQSKNEAS